MRKTTLFSLIYTLFFQLYASALIVDITDKKETFLKGYAEIAMAFWNSAKQRSPSWQHKNRDEMGLKIITALKNDYEGWRCFKDVHFYADMTDDAQIILGMMEITVTKGRFFRPKIEINYLVSNISQPGAGRRLIEHAVNIDPFMPVVLTPATGVRPYYEALGFIHDPEQRLADGMVFGPFATRGSGRISFAPLPSAWQLLTIEGQAHSSRLALVSTHASTLPATAHAPSHTVAAHASSHPAVAPASSESVSEHLHQSEYDGMNLSGPGFCDEEPGSAQLSQGAGKG